MHKWLRKPPASLQLKLPFLMTVPDIYSDGPPKEAILFFVNMVSRYKKIASRETTYVRLDCTNRCRQEGGSTTIELCSKINCIKSINHKYLQWCPYSCLRSKNFSPLFHKSRPPWPSAGSPFYLWLSFQHSSLGTPRFHHESDSPPS